MAQYITIDNIETLINQLKLKYSATSGYYGGIKLASANRSTDLSTQISVGGETSDRYYGVELDTNGKAFVNVPWTALSAATASALGGIKIGYSKNGKNYPVVLDKNSKAYVNVPWPDLSAPTSSALGGIKIGYSKNGKNYPVELDADNKAYVNVPWEGAQMTAATASALGGIKLGYSKNNKNYPVELDANSKAYVNVPWEGAQMTAATASALGGIKVGYTQNNKNYPVVLDADNKAYVNVPWTGSYPAVTTITATNSTVTVETLPVGGMCYIKSAKSGGTINLNGFAPATKDVVSNYVVMIDVPSDGKLTINYPTGKTIKWANGVSPFVTGGETVEMIFTTVNEGETYNGTWVKYF